MTTAQLQSAPQSEPKKSKSTRSKKAPSKDTETPVPVEKPVEIVPEKLQPPVKSEPKPSVSVSVEPSSESGNTGDETESHSGSGSQLKESVNNGFSDLVQYIESELASLKSLDADKSASKYVQQQIRFSKNVLKQVKNLKSDVYKLGKQKATRVSRGKNMTSGFMKPVGISSDMAKFTGWNPSEPKSRVDVTKYICNYVKNKDLQNPSDRRQIVPDPQLSKLLNYDSSKEPPLTYYMLQRKIQHHFSPVSA